MTPSFRRFLKAGSLDNPTDRDSQLDKVEQEAFEQEELEHLLGRQEEPKEEDSDRGHRSRCQGTQWSEGSRTFVICADHGHTTRGTVLQTPTRPCMVRWMARSTPRACTIRTRSSSTSQRRRRSSTRKLTRVRIRRQIM